MLTIEFWAGMAVGAASLWLLSRFLLRLQQRLDTCRRMRDYDPY